MMELSFHGKESHTFHNHFRKHTCISRSANDDSQIQFDSEKFVETLDIMFSEFYYKTVT